MPPRRTHTFTYTPRRIHSLLQENTHIHIYIQENEHPPGEHTHSHLHPGECTPAPTYVHGCQVQHGRSLNFWLGAGGVCHQLSPPPSS